MGWHGRAMPPQARPVPTFWKNSGFFFFLKEIIIIFFGYGWFGFWSMASKKFRFFASYLDKYLQNKLKQHKTNKIKAIQLVGCLPRSARLKLLA